MSIIFPPNPTIGQTYSVQDYTWRWNGTFWDVVWGNGSVTTSATSTGSGVSVISVLSADTLVLKSFSGVGVSVVDGGDTIIISGNPGLGGVSSITAVGGISGSSITGDITLVNTAPDKIVTISGGTGITRSGTYPNFTITNSAPDQIVTITGGSNIQITGTYPNFGINFTGTTSGGTFTGGTVTGATNFTAGLTANTISATTYNNLPVSGITNGTGITSTTSNGIVTITNTEPDQVVTISGGTGITTGGTYPNFTITNSSPDQTVTITGGTNIQINGSYPNFGIDFTGQTSFPYLPLSGGTLTGGTIFQSGLTANTLSATTYQNLPQSVSGTGTQDYVTKWDPNGNGIQDSQIYDNGSFIGFGVTTPIYGESVSIVTGNKGVLIDNTFIIETGNGSLGFVNGDNYSAWAGSGEIAIGTRSPLFNSVGSGNIGIGDRALQTNSSGSNNIAIGGTSALVSNDDGTSNIAIGNESMNQNVSGGQNVAVGTSSLWSNVSGGRNVSIGQESGFNNNNDNNVFIGRIAGFNHLGSDSIFIGESSDFPDTSKNYVMSIGNLIYGDISGKTIGINVSVPSVTLEVSGDTLISGGLTATTISGSSITLSNSASTISLNNATQQQIRFFSGGTGAPTYNTYSAGAKIILSDNIDSISSGYAIGVDTGSLWYGADLAGNGHDWYAGTGKLMSLASSSGLELVGLGGPTTTTMTISGTSVLGSKGGVGYVDFLKVVNNFSGATNPNKWFRVNSTGGLEILNSVYTATTLTISDNGIVGINSPASVTSNSATSNALNIGSKGQLFDDGNFHIHSSSSAVWINALDGSSIRLGTQTNSGNSTVIVDTSTVGHSFFTKVQSGFNVAFGTEITMDNLKVRINGTGGSGGLVQGGAVSGTFAAYTTLLGNVAGSALQGDTNSGGITFTTSYQNISSGQKTLSAGGDTTTLHLIDTTNSRIYRITAIHCQGTTGGYTSIERMA